MSDADLAVLRIDPRPLGGLKSMLAEVADYYEVSVEELLTKNRERRLSWARHAFMWHARQVKWDTGAYRYSTPQIAAFLGLSDHTSVLHGVRQHEKRLRPYEQQRLPGDGSRRPDEVARKSASV